MEKIANFLESALKEIVVFNLLFTRFLEESNDMMPSIMKAVKIAYSKKFVTNIQTYPHSGNLFHTIFVPYLKEDPLGGTFLCCPSPIFQSRNKPRLFL